MPDDNHVGVYGGDEQTLIATVARTPDRIANARLIAAAPEMLAALERIAAGDSENHNFAVLAIAEARAAIAKAEGK